MARMLPPEPPTTRPLDRLRDAAAAASRDASNAEDQLNRQAANVAQLRERAVALTLLSMLAHPGGRADVNELRAEGVARA
jgi:hypothetical protein